MGTINSESSGKVYGMAHRGYPVKHPENTLLSFQAARELGFTHLELDVHLTRDGVPIVMHDPTVSRMTGQKGRICRMTLEELRRLRVAGSEPIPTLEEALALVRGQMIVNVELKQSGRLYPGLEEAVAKTIAALDMSSEVIVTSFDHFSLVEFRRHMPETALGPIVYGTSSDLFHWMRQMEARYLSIKYTYLTPSLIRACKEEGIRLIAWTVNDRAAMRRIYAWDPSILICTDELELWLAEFKSKTESR